MDRRMGFVVLFLVGMLSLAGCRSQTDRGLGTAPTSSSGSAFPIEYYSSPVTIAEGEVVRVQLLNAAEHEQTAVVEIYASKGEDVVTTRGTATDLVKVEQQRLNPRGVGITEFTAKSNGVCWVHLRAATALLVPQVAFGKDRELRLVFKPGDLVKIEQQGSPYHQMRGSPSATGVGFRGVTAAGGGVTTAASTGYASPGVAITTVKTAVPAPEKTGTNLQEREGRLESERARKLTNEAWGKAEKARAEAVAKLRQTEKELEQTRAELERVRAELERLKTDANGDSFSLVGSPGELELKPGETRELTLQIRRGKGFGQQVNVGADLPRGLSVEPRKFSFTGDKDSSTAKTIKVSAGKNALPGEHYIKFTGFPDDGTIASVQVTVRVKQP